MKIRTLSAAIIGLLASVISANAISVEADTTTNYIDEAVVTGTRAKTLSGFLPQTISVVGHEELTSTQRLNILPTLNELVPGVFVTSRAMLGYGVSTGAAGGISVRGLSGGTGQMMVLIDGHPQYQGIFGHPIADSYQTLMTERVEVLRGPASVLYGSNAMGGVVNIITRKSLEDGVHTDLNLGAGSYGTLQGVLSNRIKKGKFSSVVSGQYSRSNNHRPRMGFEQYGGYGKVGYQFSDNWSAYADVDITHSMHHIQAPQVPLCSMLTSGLPVAWHRQPSRTTTTKPTAPSVSTTISVTTRSTTVMQKEPHPRQAGSAQKTR